MPMEINRIIDEAEKALRWEQIEYDDDGEPLIKPPAV